MSERTFRFILTAMWTLFAAIIITFLAAGCGQADYERERHHKEMYNAWNYFMGYQRGMIAERSDKAPDSFQDMRCRQIPKLLHHYTFHHPDNTNFPSWINFLDAEYARYLKRKGYTNIFSLEAMKEAAKEEGY